VAAKNDLAIEDVAEAIDPRPPELQRVLLRGYEAAKAAIREELVLRALLRHGNTMVDVEWRVDVITASPGGRALRAPVTLVTLTYLEDGARRALTLPAPVEALRRLRAMCGELLE
jgi:hypothetical protein